MNLAWFRGRTVGCGATMSANETRMIDRLLGANAGESAQRQALGEISDYLEESYILNLPPSKTLLEGLNRFAKSAEAPAALQAKARKLVKKYAV